MASCILYTIIFHRLAFVTIFPLYCARIKQYFMSFSSFKVPYPADPAYSKPVAYFSMEFAIHQPLKIYSGGLGFLSGSHMRSP